MTAGYVAERGALYLVGLLAFIGFGLYQQRLIYGRQRAPCFKAFLNNNWAGMVLFVALGMDYLL